MENNKRKSKRTKSGPWRPFLELIKKAGLPYIAILVVILFSVLNSAVNLLLPDATARVMAGDFSSAAILTMLGILLIQAVSLALREFSRSVARAKVTLRFREYMIKKTLSLPLAYYDKNMADQLISRTTLDTTMLSDFFGSSIPYIPATLYSFIGTFVILFSYNWRLIVLEAVIVPVVFLITILSGRIRYTWNNRIQGAIANLSAYLSGILVNIPLVKVFVKEKAEDQRGQDRINGLYHTRRKFVLFSGIVSFLTSLEGLIQSLLTIVGGAYLINAGYIDLEIWIAFYLYSSSLLGGISSLLQNWETVKAAQGAACRISEVAMENDEDQGGTEMFPKQAGNLSFNQVTFRYDTDPALDHVSFTIPAGRTTALVGPSGAGKSTIFALLERFYVPESGTITMDGRDIQEYNMTDWRRAVGYVSQDSSMFSGTIRFNMTYGLDHEVTEDELIQAAKDAQIYDFIQSLENGFDTDTGERGDKLSGGQRQRIAIARALLKNPKILLLDEATSDLDPVSKSQVEQAIERLKEGRTTIVVSHSIRSIQNADQIIVLKDGAVDAAGNHDSLMKNCGLYQRLNAVQNGIAAVNTV